MRGADGGPGRYICALPAFWVGLLYDGTALDAAWDLVKDWSPEEHAFLRDQVPRKSLETTFRGRPLAETAREALAISEAGLRARARPSASAEDETQYLGQLREVLESGKCPARAKLEAYHGRWGGSVDPAFTEEAY
jgi:glutamate--cysteine ligase